MLKKLYPLAVTAALLVAMPRAYAAAPEGVAPDSALAACMAQALTAQDKRLLLRATFSSLARHPDLKDMAALSEASHAAAEQGGARVLEALVADRCAPQARRVFQAEGLPGLAAAFRTLGETTVADVLLQPEMARALVNIAAGMDLMRVHRALSEPAP